MANNDRRVCCAVCREAIGVAKMADRYLSEDDGEDHDDAEREDAPMADGSNWTKKSSDGVSVWIWSTVDQGEDEAVAFTVYPEGKGYRMIVLVGEDSFESEETFGTKEAAFRNAAFVMSESFDPRLVVGMFRLAEDVVSPFRKVKNL